MEQDLELGQPKPQPGHGGSSDALTEPLLISESEPVIISIFDSLPRSLLKESPTRDVNAFLEYKAELVRMASSLDAHAEEAAAHRDTEIRMTLKLQLLTTLHLLYIGAMYLAYRCGYIDDGPQSISGHVNGAELGLYTSQVLIRIAEQWEHLKGAPEFRFRFDFENMPALKELAGEQKWKEIQACSDNIRVMRDLNSVLMRQLQAVSSPSSISGIKASKRPQEASVAA